ncbi:hypothetical protein Tco_0582270, partial [Tanacetum coccineum]
SEKYPGGARWSTRSWHAFGVSRRHPLVTPHPGWYILPGDSAMEVKEVFSESGSAVTGAFLEDLNS